MADTLCVSEKVTFGNRASTEWERIEGCQWRNQIIRWAGCRWFNLWGRLSVCDSNIIGGIKFHNLWLDYGNSQFLSLHGTCPWWTKAVLVQNVWDCASHLGRVIIASSCSTMHSSYAQSNKLQSVKIWSPNNFLHSPILGGPMMRRCCCCSVKTGAVLLGTFLDPLIWLGSENAILLTPNGNYCCL